MYRSDFDCPWCKNETVLNLKYKKEFQSRINCLLSQVNVGGGEFPKVNRSEQVWERVGGKGLGLGLDPPIEQV